MSFLNKVVVVTGSSSGIGAAAAIAFAKEGANVTIVGRNATKLKSVEEKCAKNGKDHLVVNADVSNDDDAKRIIESTVEKFGKIDVLVNNAGIARLGGILNGKIMETYDTVMNTNLRAVVFITTLATPHLIKTKGNIINISSVGGAHTPRAHFHAYCMSKAAMNHFTLGAALELSSVGVRVNVISPGPVKTDIIDNSGIPITWQNFTDGTALGRLSEPEEIADLILYLASDKAKAITGSNYVTDNGYLLKHN
jgi:NAD(P)-dependent dehydrogenase (short-subunit alcohol dehydrogenase family)